MGGMYGGGMGGMGMGGDWFGSSADTLGQMTQMLEMNSFFFDQLCDHASTMWFRLRDMLTWLYRLKDAIVTGKYQEAREIEFSSDEEKEAWEKKVLKRIYAVSACAAMLALWTLKKAIVKRRQKSAMLSAWGGVQNALP